MKRPNAAFFAIVFLVGALACVGCSSKKTTSPSGGNGNPDQVVISGFAFSSMTVTAGTTVTWKNDDSVTHTATSDAGSAFTFDTGDIAGGTTSTGITFSTPGAFTYHCTHHPEMHGLITVH